MKYERLTTDEQKAMLETRARQLEQEHFSHQVLIDQLKASGDTSQATTDAIKVSEEAQKILDSAHAVVDKKLSAKA